MNEQQLRLVSEFASLAPSVHNTQPWRFVANGHSLEIHADPTRRLDFLDDNARQLHISCGAAVEFARLAVRSLGQACVVRLLPGVEDPLLLATITVGHESPVTDAEQRLVDAGPRRYTDRGPYDDKPVPADVLLRLSETAAEVGCWVRTLTRPGDRLTASLLLQKGEEIEAADPRYRQELTEWLRPGPAPDGVPVTAIGAWPTERVSDVPLRTFVDVEHYPHLAERTSPPMVERDMLLLLGSDTDDRIGWLRTGRALALVLLILTDAGLVSQPLGPATDIVATRSQLQRSLGLLGYPQLLLRVGYGHGEPRTGRRPVEETLSVETVA